MKSKFQELKYSGANIHLLVYLQLGCWVFSEAFTCYQLSKWQTLTARNKHQGINFLTEFFQPPFKQPHLNDVHNGQLSEQYYYSSSDHFQDLKSMIAVLHMLIHQMIWHHWKWAGSTIKYETIPAFVICTWYIRKCERWMHRLSPNTNK